MMGFAFLNSTVGITFTMYDLEQSQIKCQKHDKKFWLISFLRFHHLFVFTWTLLHCCMPSGLNVQKHATIQKGIEIICIITWGHINKMSVFFIIPGLQRITTRHWTGGMPCCLHEPTLSCTLFLLYTFCLTTFCKSLCSLHCNQLKSLHFSKA